MTDAINKCSTNETAACCCVDVGTVIDNTDCTASWSSHFADRPAAEAMLQQLTGKAREVEFDPCDIRADFQPEADGIEFALLIACQASDFHGIPVLELGRMVVSELMARSELPVEVIDQLVFGQVVQMPEAPNIVREIVLSSWLSVATDAYSMSHQLSGGCQRGGKPDGGHH